MKLLVLVTLLYAFPFYPWEPARECPPVESRVAEEDEEDDDEVYADSGGEHYSWDNLYLDPWEGTIIEPDPYGDQ